jgi:hypothetical protein
VPPGPSRIFAFARGAWWDRGVILRSIAPRGAAARPRGALAALAAVALLAGCSASASIEAKTPKDDDGAGWEADEAPAPAERPRIRAVSDGPRTATYPGFHVVTDDKRTSIVLVEVSRDVEVKEQKAEGRLVYVLGDTKVPEKTNRLPLVTHPFGTAVSRVHLEQAGEDAMLVIETRAPVTASHRVVPTDNGVNLEVTIVGPPWGAAADARGPYQAPPPQD